MAEAERHLVPPDLDGERADRIVAVLLGISRAVGRRLVEEGDVTVDGEPPLPSQRLVAGTEIVVTPPGAPPALEPADVAFAVAHEDDRLLVVDKPAGLVVHPGAGHRQDTLAAGLIGRYPELAAMGETHRWGLVHRLDKETTGLLLVGRTPDAQRFLQEALRRRRITRVYWTMALGEVDSATGTIDAPIGRDPSSPTRMRVARNGRRAVTHYRRLARWADVTLLEVRLETGRTHQIRVHLAAIGHPVVGDRTYGRPGGDVADAGRVWLHAIQLTFPDPSGGADITVASPLPSDLSATLERLGAPDLGTVPRDHQE